MSLCASYIGCTDGNWYRQLVYWAEDKSWYICFDDDDPPELVVKAASFKDELPKQIFEALGIPYTQVFKPHRGAERMFGDDKFTKAVAVFFYIKPNEKFPNPRPWDTHQGICNDWREGCYCGGVPPAPYTERSHARATT